MWRRKIPLLSLIWMILCIPALSSEPDSRSDPAPAARSSLTLRTSVFGNASDRVASSHFGIASTLGQPTPIGIGSAAGKTLYAGFWPAFVRLGWLTGSSLPEPLVNRLFPCYPNPFNPTTTIRFSLAEESAVFLAVYDLRGRRVRNLVNEPRLPGTYTVVWDGTDDSGQIVASGVYLYSLETGNFRAVRKSLILK